MSWSGYALLSLLFAGSAPVMQKWALNLKISELKLVTISFTGFLLLYLAYSFNHLPYLLAGPKLEQYLLWGALIAFFSMVGNITLLRALNNCSNPGYAQGVINANAIPMLLFAWLIFGFPMNWQKALGVLITTAGLFLLLVQKKSETDQQKVKRDWRMPAIVAGLAFAGMGLVNKKMSDLGFSAGEILLILFLFATPTFWAMYLISAKHLAEDPHQKANQYNLIWLSIGLYILIAFVANLLQFASIGASPNPGYAQAIINTRVIVTLLLPVLIFPSSKGGEFNRRKWFAVFLTLIGVITILL